MTTLREIGEGLKRSVEETAAVATSSFQNDTVLDWPLWLVALTAVVGIYAASLAVIPVVKFVLWAVLPRENPTPREGPADPRERLLWANREGRYSPDPRVRQKWEDGQH